MINSPHVYFGLLSENLMANPQMPHVALSHPATRTAAAPHAGHHAADGCGECSAVRPPRDVSAVHRRRRSICSRRRVP